MTLEEAIADKNRPLSVSPYEWMQYRAAEDKEAEMIFDDEADRIVQEETQSEEPVKTTPRERVEIGVEQMILGCRIAMRALQQIDREDAAVADRAKYDKVKDNIFNGVAPYLAAALKVCLEGADGWKA